MREVAFCFSLWNGCLAVKMGLVSFVINGVYEGANQCFQYKFTRVWLL